MNLKENILLILLVTVILFIVTILIRESFTGTVSAQTNANMANANKNIPTADPKVVASAKAGLLNIIDTRPDLIESAKLILAEPKIRATLNSLLFDDGSSESTS
jgi:hypothetical protein